MSTAESEPLDAHEEEECLLCEPAPHPNCEMYTVIELLDREHVPLGEDAADHLVAIPVCLAHYQALDGYRSADSVQEVEVR